MKLILEKKSLDILESVQKWIEKWDLMFSLEKTFFQEIELLPYTRGGQHHKKTTSVY